MPTVLLADLGRKLVATACGLCVAGAVLADAPRPNILIVLLDDLGYADVGFNGAADIKTPHIDALAEKGMIFSEAYVPHPFCGPSRAGLMTGRYPHKFGAQFNLPEDGSFLGIPTSETFFSEVLQEAGYYTGAIGKWHLGDTDAYHPNNRGFTEFYGFLGGGHDYFPAHFRAAYERQRAQGLQHIWEYLTPLERNGVEVEETEYVTDGLSREAEAFVRAASTKPEPFFLYLAYNAPHTPLQAIEQDLAVFRSIDDEKRRTYAAMVHAVDRGVGNIVSALRETNLLDDTLIVFFSDNGGRLDQGGNNGPLRAGKGSVYEGGFRSPMFMHWPAQIAAGRRFEHPVLALDLYPTFAALAGAEIPPDKPLDGTNLWASLLSGENPRPGQPIYALRHREGHSDAAVRRDQWKAVKVGKDEPWRLYDIESDPGENHDVASENRALLTDMVKGMEKWSWDNVPPRWFHKSSEGAQWRADGMPRFHRTFQPPADDR